MIYGLLLYSLLPVYSKDNTNLCGNLRCCPGYEFDWSGQCVGCPDGRFGVNCTNSCPPGFYGHNCRKPCECSHEFCNATIGCPKYDVNYLNPTTFSIVIPTTLGLLCIFLLTCTLIVLKMRQRAQQLVPPPASERSCESSEYDLTSPGQDSRTYNEIDPPPPPYMVDLDDLTCRQVDSKTYDTLTE
uniref:Cell death abnormality protein 1-like n=1 Tax=Crassostrea virginica TaxID=6565 RepID=A0A8B8AYU2_CRAVI|nr:cell death abnormality protein 1-like [Crassostrea virginica]